MARDDVTNRETRPQSGSTRSTREPPARAADRAPLVSVIIPAHNAEATIVRALNSALNQTYRPIEIIVVDDGSKDGTCDTVESFKPGVISFVTNPASHGAAAARNLGVSHSRGDYLAFLDADDEWLPEKTVRQLSVIEAASDMSFVACDAVFVSTSPHAPVLANKGRLRASGADAWKTLLAYPYVVTSSVIARRSKLTEAGLFDTSLPVAEDQDLWIRLAKCGEVGYLPETLVRYHDTAGSLSKRHIDEETTIVLGMVRRHLEESGDVLLAAERRTILGHRYAQLGRNLYARGVIRQGMHLLLRAILLGNAPLENMSYLIAAARPAQWLKRVTSPRHADKPLG